MTWKRLERLIRGRVGRNVDTATLADVMAVGDQVGQLIRVAALEDAVQRDRGEMACINGQDDQP